MRHIPAIDGLRALACLSVVAYHAGLPVPAGFVGVDVFFVISGYLITRLLIEDLPGVDFVGFYARRAKRILPAMALVLAVTVALCLALLPDAHDAVRSGAAAAAFVANVFFQGKTGGYWSANAATMPLLHLWSLSVEEQFYLVWPVVLLLARKRPIAALWTLAAVSLITAEALLWWSPNAAFYQMPARAWELSAGGLVALGAIRFSSPRVALLILLAACFVPFGHFPGVGALPAVLGAAWLLAVLHAGGRAPVLESRPAVAVGLISYSLYLWHWPLLALYRATHVGESPLGVRLGLVALAFVLAALTYRYVETPFRRAKSVARRSVAAGAISAAALSLCAFALAPPAIRARPAEELYAERCAADSVGRAFKAPECVKDARKVVLWGDSFAWPWRSLALAVAADRRLPATQLVAPGCPVTARQTIERATPAETLGCRKHNDETLAYLAATGADTVVIATNLADLFHDFPRQAGPGLTTLVAELRPHVRRIVIVAPTPDLLDAVENCDAAKDAACMVTRAQFDEQAGAARRTLAALAGPKVQVVDAADWFMVRGRVAYHDKEHVSEPAVREFLRQRPGEVTR